MSKQGFKELVVWQRAKKLAVTVYKLTLESNLAKHYALADQIRRSSISVPSNIAEGDERDTDKDSVRFFYIAKGSLAELVTQLEIACEVSLLTPEQIDPLSAECNELGRMLGALIKARSATYRPSPLTYRLYFYVRSPITFQKTFSPHAYARSSSTGSPRSSGQPHRLQQRPCHGGGGG